MNMTYIDLIEKVLDSFRHEFGDDGELDPGEPFIVNFNDGVVIMDMEDPFCVSFEVFPCPPASIDSDLGINIAAGPWTLEL